MYIIDTEKNNSKKRACDKTFCYNCLSANFPLFLTEIKSREWKCPCCMDQCQCSSCRKNKTKVPKSNMNNTIKNNKGCNSLINDISCQDMTFNKNFNDINNHINKDNVCNFDWGFINKVLGKYWKEKHLGVNKPKKAIVTDYMCEEFNKAKEEYVKVVEGYLQKRRKREENDISNNNNI